MVCFWDTRQKKTTLLSSVSYDIHIFYPSASKLCEMLTQDQFRSHSKQQMHISGDSRCVFSELQKFNSFSDQEKWVKATLNEKVERKVSQLLSIRRFYSTIEKREAQV